MKAVFNALLAALAVSAAGCAAGPLDATAASGLLPEASPAPVQSVTVTGKLMLKGRAENPTVYLHNGGGGEFWEVQGLPRDQVATLQGRRVQLTGYVVRTSRGFLPSAMRAQGIEFLPD